MPAEPFGNMTSVAVPLRLAVGTPPEFLIRPGSNLVTGQLMYLGGVG